MSNAVALRTVLGSETSDKSVLGQAILKVIQGATSPEERVDLFAIALSERDTVPKTPRALPNKGISQDDWDQLAKTHADMVDGHLKMAFFRAANVKGFASEILRLVDFVTEENEKTYVLARTLFSAYVPYRELPGKPVHMNDASYRHKLDSEKNRVGLVDYIMGLSFDQRTERASVLLQVIDDTTDKDLRVALLAHAMYVFEKQVTEGLVEKLGK